MIPQDYITVWSRVAPWTSRRQVEQDLIISRALVAIFSDPFLHGELRFRGGTALNKLHFPVPLRYSEDIDLVRTTAGPISPLLDRLHGVLDPWLGKPRFDQSPVAPKLRALLQRNKGRDLFDLDHALTRSAQPQPVGGWRVAGLQRRQWLVPHQHHEVRLRPPGRRSRV